MVNHSSLESLQNTNSKKKWIAGIERNKTPWRIIVADEFALAALRRRKTFRWKHDFLWLLMIQHDDCLSIWLVLRLLLPLPVSNYCCSLCRDLVSLHCVFIDKPVERGEVTAHLNAELKMTVGHVSPEIWLPSVRVTLESFCVWNVLEFAVPSIILCLFSPCATNRCHYSIEFSFKFLVGVVGEI